MGFVMRLIARLPFLFIAGRYYGAEALGRFGLAVLSVFMFVILSVLMFGETGFASGKKLDAPFIRQMPELPRGCEVTSLAMLLGSQGVPVNKMTLAGQMKKVPFKSGGFYGNPYDGFVGNMYTYSQSGYGVYHGPIAALAERYLPGRVVDFTGSSAGEIYKKFDGGNPVWVVTNNVFKRLPSGFF